MQLIERPTENQKISNISPGDQQAYYLKVFERLY